MRNITGPMATPFSSLMRFTDIDLFGVYVAPISVLMGGADAGRRGGETGVGQAARPACRSWLCVLDRLRAMRGLRSGPV